MPFPALKEKILEISRVRCGRGPKKWDLAAIEKEKKGVEEIIINFRRPNRMHFQPHSHLQKAILDLPQKQINSGSLVAKENKIKEERTNR